MPPLRNGRATNRTSRTQAEHDIMEGLPVRQWRKQLSTINMSAPKEVSAESQKHASSIWRELPMPAGSELYAPMAQELLRRARLLYREPSVGSDESRSGSDEKKDSEPDAQYARFNTLRWSQLPKDQEEPEREFLAKRRKGLPSIHVQDTALRKATIKQTTETGEVKFLEVMVPQGISIQTEVSENDAVAAGSVIEKAAPGAVIEGLGVVANTDGVVLVTEQAVVPQKRKFVPRKKKGGPGRGRKKWKAAAAEKAAAALVPTEATAVETSEVKTEEGGEKPDVQMEGATNAQDQEVEGDEGSENDDENDEGEEGDDGDEEDDENENGDETTMTLEPQSSGPQVAAQTLPASLSADSTDPRTQAPLQVESTDKMVVDDQAANDDEAEAEGEDDAVEMTTNATAHPQPETQQQTEEPVLDDHVHPPTEIQTEQAEEAEEANVDGPEVVDEASSSLQALNESDSLPKPVEQFQPMDEEIKPVDEAPVIEETTVSEMQTTEPLDQDLPDIPETSVPQEPQTLTQETAAVEDQPVSEDVEMSEPNIEAEAPLESQAAVSEEQTEDSTNTNVVESQEGPEPETTAPIENELQPLSVPEHIAGKNLTPPIETDTLEDNRYHVHPASEEVSVTIEKPEEPDQSPQEQSETKPVSDEEILQSTDQAPPSLSTDEQPQDEAPMEIASAEAESTLEPKPASESILQPETSTIQNTTAAEPVPLTSEQQTDSPQAQVLAPSSPLPIPTQAEEVQLRSPSPIPHSHPRPKLSVSFKTATDDYESVSTPERPEMSPITIGQQSTPSLDTNPRPRLGISIDDRELTATPERPAISPITIADLDEQDIRDRTVEETGIASQLEQDPLDLNQPVTHLPSPPPPPEPTAAVLPHADASVAIDSQISAEQVPVATSSVPSIIPPPMPLEPSTEAEGPTDDIPPEV